MAWAVWLIGLAAAAIGAGVCCWALFRDRARGRARCPRCWYDLTPLVPPRGAGADESPPGVCPECGRRWQGRRELQRTRRRWRLAAAGAALALASGWVAPNLALRSWVAIVPQPALDVVIAMFFVEEAERLVAPGGAGPTGPTVPPGGIFAPAITLGAGPPAPRATSWNNALQSWRLQRELRSAAQLDDDDVRGLSDAYTSVSSAGLLMQSAPPYERRGLARALGRIAQEGQSSGLRRAALDSLLMGPEIVAVDSRWLWRAARREGSWDIGPQIAQALFDANRRARGGDEALAAWLERVLAQQRLTAAVRYGLHRAAIEHTTPLVSIIEADIGRAHAGADLEISIRLLARRADGQAAVTRLLGHPAPEVRCAAARSLTRVYIRDERVAAALAAVEFDEDEGVREAVVEALAFNRQR